jgi:hypothetical protein
MNFTASWKELPRYLTRVKATANRLGLAWRCIVSCGRCACSSCCRWWDTTCGGLVEQKRRCCGIVGSECCGRLDAHAGCVGWDVLEVPILRASEVNQTFVAIWILCNNFVSLRCDTFDSIRCPGVAPQRFLRTKESRSSISPSPCDRINHEPRGNVASEVPCDLSIIVDERSGRRHDESAWT